MRDEIKISSLPIAQTYEWARDAIVARDLAHRAGALIAESGTDSDSSDPAALAVHGYWKIDCRREMQIANAQADLARHPPRRLDSPQYIDHWVQGSPLLSREARNPRRVPAFNDVDFPFPYREGAAECCLTGSPDSSCCDLRSAASVSRSRSANTSAAGLIS